MILNSPYISGSLTVTGNIIASGSITLSGSVASASFADNAATASFVTLAQTASFVTTAQTASFVANAQSASNAVIAQTASFANAFTVAGTLTAQTLVVQTITSSVDFVTGSTQFGSLLTNTHVFSGSVTMNPNGLFVSSSGVVGIGTTSPGNLLHLSSSSTSATGIRFTLGSEARNHYLVSSSPNVSTGRDLGLLAFRSLTLKAGDGIAEGEIYVNAYENIYLNTSSSYTTRLFVSASGLIGIGTTTPSTKVHIYEPLTNTTSYLTIQNNRARNAAVYTVTTNGGFYAGTSIGTDTFNYQIYDGVAGVSRITVDSVGNIGMGTSNPVATLPTGSSVLINNGWTLNSTIIASRKVLEINSNDNNGGNVGLFLRQLNKSVGLDIWSDNYYGNTYIDSRFDNTAAYIGFRMRTANQANIIQPLTITATGNVGINSSTVSDKLDVYGNIRASVNTSYFTTFGYSGGTLIRMVSPSAEVSDNMIFKIDGASSSTAGNQFIFQTQAGNTTPVTTLWINKLGDVSIGTTASTKYQVLNLINDANTLGAAIGLARSSGQFITNAGAGDLVIGNATNKNILFGNTGAGTTEYMRITGGGNVGIGTDPSTVRLYVRQSTAQGTSTPALRVSYIGAGDGNSQNVAMFTNDATLATSGYIYIGSYSGSDWYIGKNVAGTSANYNFQLGTATNNILGTLTTAGVWSTTGGGTSDRRVKKDIADITQNVLPFINELKPVSFKFKEDASQKTRRGFIAQDVLETSIPDLVLGDGAEENGTYGLDYDGILALAIKAIQELKSQNDDLQSQINELKA